MLEAPTFRWLADAVLLLHLAVVVFVVGGLGVVLAGNLMQWRWVNALPFRVAHLVAIAVVVVQAWLGQLCPLTVLESWLRRQAGEASDGAGFIEHWVQRLLFHDLPFWAFTLAYTLFGMLVVAAWWVFPPRHDGRRRSP